MYLAEPGTVPLFGFVKAPPMPAAPHPTRDIEWGAGRLAGTLAFRSLPPRRRAGSGGPAPIAGPFSKNLQISCDTEGGTEDADDRRVEGLLRGTGKQGKSTSEVMLTDVDFPHSPPSSPL